MLSETNTCLHFLVQCMQPGVYENSNTKDATVTSAKLLP